MKVFVAGFQHETNTFAPSFADWAAFESSSGYVPYARGEAMLRQMAPTCLPIAGFLRAARERGWRIVPSVWAGAMPSNRVTRDAFERIAGEIVDDLRRAGPVDAIYLDLHGAAAADGLDDAEGELLERVRGVAGDALPVVASLDLHANVSRRMLDRASALTAFRSYPHVDMVETGERAAALLAHGAELARATPPRRPAARMERVPFLLPLNAQCTALEPARSVMARLARLEAAHGVSLNFAMGFSAADIADCGPTVFGHGDDPAAVQAAVRALHEEIVARRREWKPDWLEPADAVRQALASAEDADVAAAADAPAAASGPVVIADTQDNPGAGGDANTTGMLHALLAAGAGRRFPGRVAIGLMWDPAAARAAFDAGVGAPVALSIGRAVPTFTGRPSDPPLQAQARVRAVHDGVLALHGPMTEGVTVHLGPCARVEVDGVSVLLASEKIQMLDLDLYRFLGVEPCDMRVLVNKSSVHFRAAFEPLASRILVARSPGPMAADPADLPWRHLPPDIARSP